MNSVKNDYPFIATIRNRPGNVEIKPFYTEAEFLKYTDWANPTWAILTDEFTGKIITQVSYPD